MKLPHDCRSIEEVRQEIDEIDQAIIGLIGKRFSFVQEIVKFKSSSDEVYAKNRYQDVISQRRKLAVAHNLDPDVIENIYTTLMAYFIREQLDILKRNQQ
jgi:isochorismate pyruvate lyase